MEERFGQYRLVSIGMTAALFVVVSLMMPNSVATTAAWKFSPFRFKTVFFIHLIFYPILKHVRVHLPLLTLVDS